MPSPTPGELFAGILAPPALYAIYLLMWAVLG